jgi:quercetin dioxygenase-like cupin family protein
MSAGANSGVKQLKHPGEELVYVLSGQVRFTVGNDVYALKMGDSLHFSGDVPHRWENLGKKTAQLIWFALRSG